MNTIRPIFLAGLATLSVLSAAMASDRGEPHYFGQMTGDEEKNTFGYSTTGTSVLAQPALGPARYFGPVTGSAEKDTFAYTVAPTVRTTFVATE